MKWLLIVILSLVGVVALIVIIGWLLPRNHKVSRTLALRQAPQAVWDLITGPPLWRPEIRGFQPMPPHDGHRVWRETDGHGQLITYEAIESTPPNRLVVKIADPSLPFGGTWTYSIAPTPQGCTLTITEDGEIYNPIFRFVARIFISQSATIDAYFKAVTAKFGES
ncbi:MAG: SRPBCC family protein [Acidobacteriia bacterium]|nr:SRPBCC family protein [Terriglobia bacterium]